MLKNVTACEFNKISVKLQIIQPSKKTPGPESPGELYLSDEDYSKMCLNLENRRRFSSSPGVKLADPRRLSMAVRSLSLSFSGT